MLRPAFASLCALAAAVSIGGVAGASTPDPAAAAPLPVLVEVTSPAAVDDVARLAGRVGADEIRELPAASTIAVTATSAEIAALHESGAVVEVMPDIPMTTQLADTTLMVGSSGMRAKGFSGVGGRTVVVIDSGVAYDHPFFGGRVVDGACFSATADCPNDETTDTGVVAGQPCTFNINKCAHGTHVAGIVAGSNSSFKGVASGAQIISIFAGSRLTTGSGCSEGAPCLSFTTGDLIAALTHVAELTESYDIVAVNLSVGSSTLFGGSNCDSSAPAGLKDAVSALNTAGIPTVVAAGNSGSTTGASFPACVSSTVAVGATGKNDVVASFSNSSPAVDMWAPGGSVASSVPYNIYDSGYGITSGTSMAAPHVAAAFAVIDQLLPSETLAEKRYRITKTGIAITDTRNGVNRKLYRLKMSSDVTRPQTLFTQKPASSTTSKSVKFGFSSEAGARFDCKVDSGNWFSCTSVRTVTVSAKGTHRFYVRARDAAGNADLSPASQAWTYR